jgi:hypothetical protein
MKIKYFLMSILLFCSFIVKAQNCDCTIYPVKSGCEKECGLFYVINGTEDQLEKNLKIDKPTASRIAKIPNRKKFKTIQDFKPSLPKSNYEELELKYNNFITSVTIQNNQNGNNFNGGQTVQTQINGNNPFVYIINNDNAKVEAIKYEIAQKNRERRTKISQFYREGFAMLNLLKDDISVNPETTNKINSWYLNTLNYLDTIELSFTVRFEMGSSDNAYSYNLKCKENEVMYKAVKEKLQLLASLISELKSDFYN